jgi:hypothetical protein
MKMKMYEVHGKAPRAENTNPDTWAFLHLPIIIRPRVSHVDPPSLPLPSMAGAAVMVEAAFLPLLLLQIRLDLAFFDKPQTVFAML